MLVGIASIILFNVVDTIYVGRLGERALAAMSFTFPVVSIVMSLAQGLGLGLTSVVSRAIGQDDDDDVRRLTTHGLLLANFVVVAVAAIGWFSVEPVFRLIGAPDDLLPMISAYMRTWFLGVGFLVIPMLGNGAIRATGDTKSPSYIMVVAGLVNIVLDPLLIFGIGPFPRLELQGAALATVISWTVTFGAAFWLLRRNDMLEFRFPAMGQLIDSWRRILRIGLPAAATNLLVPVSSGLLTRIVATHGTAAVAAYGVGLRLESLGMIGVFAMSTAITPFVGQNFGAHACDRVRQAVRYTASLAWKYGLGAALLFGLGAWVIAIAFSDDPDVRQLVRVFLWVLPFSWGAYGLAIIVNSVYNAMDRPLRSSALIVLRLFGLTLPLAWAGSYLYDVVGVFAGLAIANLTIGVVAYLSIRSFLHLAERDPHTVIGPRGALPVLSHDDGAHPVVH